MQRGPSFESFRSRGRVACLSSLALVLLVATPGCDDSDNNAASKAATKAGKPAVKAVAAEPKPTSPADVAKPPADPPGDEAVGKTPTEPTPAAAVPPPPPGWTRVELSTVVAGMTGSVDVPAGVAATSTTRQEIDADGFSVESEGIVLGPRVGGATLETMVDLPSRFASAAAMAKFHGQFEQVSSEEFAPDHWAVVQRWRPGECMLHGWSAAAGLSFNVFKAPCDEMAQWVKVCGTLRAGPKPNTSPMTAAGAFPELDPAAAEVAVVVGRAVARDDDAMLLSAVGPAGVKVGAKAHTAESLKTALEGKSVVQVVAPILHQPDMPAEGQYGWNSDGSSADLAQVWFSSGYGEQPYFTLSKSGETWHVTEFGVFDHGEP
ncbi:MAG: hypothetical protein K0V04_41155 [Deltaproteobacteria bacterium]|nr:hypothetical protein [Deltaproteobacteria bacterium]